MLRRLRSFFGVDQEVSIARRLISVKESNRRRRVIVFRQPDMLETVHEIAIYIHRFHNLDLFQQGWYQIKISMGWEDSSRETCGTPARVVQYEAPDFAPEDVCGVWRIDDIEQSFSTQPFKIKYARQDILLSIVVSFNLNLAPNERPSTSAVMLKFELLYAPMLENGIEVQASLDSYPAAVHEFRIPPKALLGLHTYCPVHFDVFHSVLIDLSIHATLLKAGTVTLPLKNSKSEKAGDINGKGCEGPNQLLQQGIGSRAIELIKALLMSREFLLEDLRKISQAIDQTIEDISDADLNLDGFKFMGASLRYDNPSGGRLSGKKGVGQLVGMLENILEKSNGSVEVRNDVMLYSLSKEELLDVFFSLGTQLSSIWNAFLKFHRINRMKILGYLYDTWAADRKTEWSIWMVHSKIDIPHRYLRSAADDRNLLGKVVSKKSNDEQAQLSSIRAEMHRKTIAQMNINNRSIQDMHIFGDPSRVPVVILEQHVMNVPTHGSPTKAISNSLDDAESATISKGRMPNSKKGRLLKIVVFVHGFQGHHLDLRLVRNQWLLLDPVAECLMSETNEDKTSGDFREMGHRLAEEVTAFVRKKMDKYTKYGGCKAVKLSFVGHSIGNVIIRTALADSLMDPFLKYLYTYMSISGPHLGYWYSSNSLFNSGLWLLKKLKGSQVIHQLTFSDDQDLQNTFFYKLCKQKTLENFKNILLLSSPQDGYVPYHSARIELCHASASDQSKKAQVFLEMLNNCLDQIRAPSSEHRTFIRCDVNFDQSAQGKSLNTIIGRAAHIEFLETDIFAKFIMWSFPKMFQ